MSKRALKLVKCLLFKLKVWQGYYLSRQPFCGIILVLEAAWCFIQHLHAVAHDHVIQCYETFATPPLAIHIYVKYICIACR